MKDSWGWDVTEPIGVGVLDPRAMDDDEDWEEKAWQSDGYDEPDELDGFEEEREDWDDDDDDDELELDEDDDDDF